MKRHYSDDLELEVLSERSFAKRLKIDEKISVSEVSFTTIKCQTDKREKYGEPERWLKGTRFAHSELRFDALNSTLGELHQQREERKLFRKSQGPMTSLLIPDQRKNRGLENQPIFYPYGTASTDFPVSKDSWANCLRKQQHFQRDYETRCRFETLSDNHRGDKSDGDFFRSVSTAENDLQQPCLQHQPRENFVIPYSPPYQRIWNSVQGRSVSSNGEDQMEVD